MSQGQRSEDRGRRVRSALSVLCLLTSVFCPLSFAEQQEEAKDTDQDGKLDEWRITDGGIPVRIERDRDEDGRREVGLYFEEGKPVRSEVDRNLDGQADLIRFFREGRPDREQGDLNFDGRIDAWTFFEQGMKDLVILDKNYDGKPDAWFTYGQGGLKLMGGRVDEDFDGKIDRTFGAFPEKEDRQPW